MLSGSPRRQSDQRRACLSTSLHLGSTGTDIASSTGWSRIIKRANAHAILDKHCESNCEDPRAGRRGSDSDDIACIRGRSHNFSTANAHAKLDRFYGANSAILATAAADRAFSNGKFSMCNLANAHAVMPSSNGLNYVRMRRIASAEIACKSGSKQNYNLANAHTKFVKS